MILMIYQVDIFREYVLPNTNNQDYPIILDRNQFHIKDNIMLMLEIAENKWILHESNNYSMSINHEYKKDIMIEDGDIIFFKTANGEKFQGIVVDVEESFKVFKKYDISSMDYISIGKDNHSIIQYEFKDLVSKNHSVIRRHNDGFYLEDSSSNGVFVNYVRIGEQVRLNFGDAINIFGLHIIYLDGVIAVSSNYGNVNIDKTHLMEYKKVTGRIDTEKSEKGKKDKEVFFNRSPRNIPTIYTDEVEIEPPPSPKIAKKKPIIFTIGPSFTMAIPMLLGCLLSIYGAKSQGRTMGAYMYTGIITAIGSAILGIIWAIANLKYAAREEKEEEVMRFDSYGNYLLEIADELKHKYEKNTKALYSMYPSARDCVTYISKTSLLWNRNSSHDDFLFFRLGVGDIPFQVSIKKAKEKFTLVQDNLKKKPALLLDEYKMLRNVPVGVDIGRKKLIGLVGGKNMNGAIQIMYNMVVQIAVNNCYTDVKMAFIYNEKSHKDKERWMFAKWLPHVWSEDKKTRYVANDELSAKDVFYELANVIRHRSEECVSRNKDSIPKPYYVLFIEEPAFLEGELIKKYIYEPHQEYGLTTFIMAETYEQLPNGCEDIIECDHYVNGIYNTMDTTGSTQTVSFDEMDVVSLTNMAKRLNGIRVNEMESNADIPNSLDFLEMYGVNNLKELQVIDRWRKNRTYNTMKALVGKKAGGSDCYLDIHEKYHGPHGLIAGTTGSGKSETLQTYILSLAINYSPDDIGFFIIDFKGGGMANLFSNLPHMIGQISNLSGNQVRRAMISIKSENMRRQRLFSEYGVNNINLYTRLYKDNETQIPIPHLFIIIDEFAELKREEPDFMRELISVAQVGRSLGVHLILATQRPSGTVDDNIWSNSKFRLCLRVQDKQDSNDMLHKPDAAYITQAGRCYLQVGNDEIYELFQSGWSGAIYDENAQKFGMELATMLTSTGKTAIVGSRAKIKRKEEEKRNYYRAIIEIVMSEMFSHKITDMSEADDNTLSELINDVIEQMNREGLEYENCDSNIKRMYDMFRLWPRQNLSAEQIAGHIIEEASAKSVKLPEMKERTQLNAIVEYLRKLAKENGYVRNLQLWLPVLPKELYFNSLVEEDGEYQKAYFHEGWAEQGAEWKIEVPVGLYDDPENQAQAPVYINFSESGHLAVCGTIVSGKSTLLQTIMYALTMKYTADYINIYALDFSSRMLLSFENMPQVGGILYENNMDEIGKLFNMLNSIMEERKRILGGGNYAQYVKAYGVKFPSIFLIVDNYANFVEKTEDVYADLMLRIAREGVGYGIFLILSSAGFGMAEIPNRLGDTIKNIVCLEMGDKFKYMDVFHVTHISVLPEAEVKGRGLVSINGSILEFQTALCLKAEDDYKRGQLIAELADKMSETWTGRVARKIPHIPEKPVMSEFNQIDEVQDMLKSYDKIPVAYNQRDASVYAINLSKTYCYMITGKPKTGKTGMLKSIMQQAAAKHCRMAVYEKDSNELEKISSDINAEYLGDDQSLFNYFKELLPEFVRRNKLKKDYIAEGKNEEEIYECMKEEQPIFIFISDMNQFIKSIYKPDSGVGNMNGFAENIIEKGELHNIYFFAVINTDEAMNLVAYQSYKSYISYKSGVHLGGNISSQRIFTFQNIYFTESGKALKKGIGLVPSGEDGMDAEKIVIPLFGR